MDNHPTWICARWALRMMRAKASSKVRAELLGVGGVFSSSSAKTTYMAASGCMRTNSELFLNEVQTLIWSQSRKKFFLAIFQWLTRDFVILKRAGNGKAWQES